MNSTDISSKSYKNLHRLQLHFAAFLFALVRRFRGLHRLLLRLQRLMIGSQHGLFSVKPYINILRRYRLKVGVDAKGNAGAFGRMSQDVRGQRI